MMQVQGSQGAGGAVPRGGGLPAASQDDAKTSENIQRLGGLLAMMKQQKQAQEGKLMSPEQLAPSTLSMAKQMM